MNVDVGIDVVEMGDMVLMLLDIECR